MSKRKIYQNVDGLAFIYKKNAKAENSEFSEIEISQDEFKKAVEEENFADVENFLKNNPHFAIMDVSHSTLSAEGDITNIDDIEDLPPEEEKKENSEILQKFEELQKQLDELKKENQKLKNGKLNLSFNEVQNLVSKKAELLRQLEIYEIKKERFKELQFADDDSEILERSDMFLKFQYGESSYNKETILLTSSTLVLSEFIPFIIKKLENKCNALRTEIETINI